MPRPSTLERMTLAELTELRHRVDQLMIEKQASAKAELRKQMMDMAKAQGLSLDAVLSRKGRGKGTVPVKYRDPNNPANTWTGRGRTPLWLVAATKGGKSKREDFLV